MQLFSSAFMKLEKGRWGEEVFVCFTVDRALCGIYQQTLFTFYLLSSISYLIKSVITKAKGEAPVWT